MLQFILFSWMAALVRPFLSFLCGLFATLFLIEEAAASSFSLDPLAAKLESIDSQTTASDTIKSSSTTAMLAKNNIAEFSTQKTDKANAVAKISGSRHPGIIEHFLVRPLPESTSTSNRLSIMLSYPSIGRTDVDADIRHWITDIADSFEKNFDSTLLNFETNFDNYSANVDNSDSNIELHAVYDISQPSSKALSITFELWNKTSANQSNLDVLTLNYSLINGQRLEFSDIFGKPDQALKIMSNFSRNVLNNRYGLGRKQMVYNGTEPLIENFSSLTLTPKGICINFQPYQVASWEMGVQKVEISLEELSKAQPFTVLWGR